ncbi:methylation-associated defense system helix-turn-helix domain-containing protein MAD1 [Glaciimonas sp. GNP009]
MFFTMIKPKSTSDILTLPEVAEYLKVAERTLYRLAATKKIPAFKVGGTWRFPRADIDQWIKRQTSETLGDDGSDSPGRGD